jgi:hypothetical protein
MGQGPHEAENPEGSLDLGTGNREGDLLDFPDH